jgi:hypothetical protein
MMGTFFFRFRFLLSFIFQGLCAWEVALALEEIPSFYPRIQGTVAVFRTPLPPVVAQIPP